MTAPDQPVDPAGTDRIAAALVAVQQQMPTVHKGKTANVPMKAGGSYCLAPETRVLTESLDHVSVGKLAVGDRLAAFDERGPRRRWQSAVVLASAEKRLPCARVTLSDGTVIVASTGHQWLTCRADTFQWLTTEELRAEKARTVRCPDGYRHPTRVVRLTDTWDPDSTWRGGYVAAAFDGEGSLTQQDRVLHLTLAQRDNYLLRSVEAVLTSHGFDFSRRGGSGTHHDVNHLRLNGGVPEVMRLLGTFGTGRLRLRVSDAGQARALARPHVVSVEPVGEQTVVALHTSTRTLVAEGLAHHNSYKYAGLADVSAAILPLLAANGIAWSCVPREASRGYELAGTLLHSSGQSLSGSLPLHGNDPQQLGSAITYARRYLLGCLTGIVTDDDTDAGPAKGAAQTRGWDGPSTAQLLNQIDADASRAGVTYEQAVAKLLTGLGLSGVADLEAVEPWRIKPYADTVHAHADKVVADAEAAAREKAGAARSGDGWGSPAGAGESGEQPPA